MLLEQSWLYWMVESQAFEQMGLVEEKDQIVTPKVGYYMVFGLGSDHLEFVPGKNICCEAAVYADLQRI